MTVMAAASLLSIELAPRRRVFTEYVAIAALCVQKDRAVDVGVLGRRERDDLPAAVARRRRLWRRRGAAAGGQRHRADRQRPDPLLHTRSLSSVTELR